MRAAGCATGLALLLLHAPAALAAAPGCTARVEIAPPHAVAGQQVVWRVRIGSSEAVETVEWSRPPVFAGLRTETLPGDPQPTLDGPPVAGFRVRDERRALFAERAGRYRLEAPPLRCTRRDGTRERAPVPVAELRVDAPPRDGRPDGWDGLVGPLTLQQTVVPRGVSLGESVRVAVMARGAGNLWAMAAPYDAAAFPGSELFSRRPEQVLERGRRLGVRRHFVYDLVPRAEGRLVVPGLSVPYFDPAARSYAVARSEPVVVHVGPRLPAEGAPDARAPAPTIPAAPRSGPSDASGPGALAPWLAGLALGVAGLALWRRRATARAATAVAETDDPAALERALRAALARHVDDAASVTSEELAARRPQGAAVASAAELLASLERARFDPQAPPPDADAVRRAIGRL